TDGLIHACLSITTLDEDIRRILEPRTASINQRFKAVSTLAKAGIPVTVNIAPIIPGLTEHEIIGIAKRAKDAGARRIGYNIVRLNDEIGDIFTNWVHQALPDRAERILNRIRDCRGGELGEKRFHKRQTGEGEIARMIKQQYELAKRLYFPNAKTDWPAFNLEPFEQRRKPQLSLFPE
ncbi:MAG: radical SAM protein, partial [Bacteroidota bacterium]